MKSEDKKAIETVIEKLEITNHYFLPIPVDVCKACDDAIEILKELIDE